MGEVLSLALKNRNIINCFGIQPIFIENGKADDNFLSFVYRVGNSFNKVGVMSHMSVRRDSDVILKNKFHINDAPSVVVNTLLNNRTFTFKQKASLDELMEPKNHEKLKETILIHLERIRYYTMMCMGNFLITSRKDLYNRRLFTAKEVLNFEQYLVSEDLLPRNIIILGHRNRNVYRCPYLACPLIDKNHFDDICYMNGIDIDDFPFDKKLRYPIIEKYKNLYSLYQSYLDNVDVPYWYIETFNKEPISRQKAYYSTLFFD